jgi:murein DD-endopeptidase MepM/ murein hydrolase activator NlpD
VAGGAAAIALIGSAAIVPSFASSLPASASSVVAAGSTTARASQSVAAQRQRGLDEAVQQIRDLQLTTLLNRHHQAATKAASAVKAEAARLRDLSTFLWPTEGGVSSGFGWRIHPILGYRRLHNGADIGGACNNPIYAVQSGTVVRTGVGYSGGSGNNVRIDHGTIDGHNIQTGYLHMTRFVVKVGQRVNKGDLVGYVGSTGLSTACHLHLSLYKDGVGTDPLKYVKK